MPPRATVAEAGATGAGYDVFISYAHADKAFARKLEQALQRYRAPLFSRLAPRRLSVYRDESEANAAVLGPALTRALQGSRKLVVLCSPEARDRPWVNEEIRQFAAAHGAANLVPVLIAGTPAHDPDADPQAAFPAALFDAFRNEPWAPDFRDAAAKDVAPARATVAWFHLLAALYGVSREVIERRERSRHVMRAGATAAVLAAVAGAGGLFVQQRSQTSSIALAQQADQERDPETRLRLVLDAVAAAPTEQAGQAAVRALGEVLPRDSLPRPALLVSDPGGRYVAAATKSGTALVWDTQHDVRHALCGFFDPIEFMAFSPDGRFLVALTKGGRSGEGGRLAIRLLLWDVERAKLIRKAELPGSTIDARVNFAPDSSSFVISTFDDESTLWRLPAGTMVRSLERLRGAVRYHPSGSFALLHPRDSLSGSDHLLAFSPATGEVFSDFGEVEDFEFFAFLGEGRRIVFYQSGLPVVGGASMQNRFTTVDFGAQRPADTIRTVEARNFDFTLLMRAQPRPSGDELSSPLGQMLSMRHRAIVGRDGRFKQVEVSREGQFGIAWNDTAAISFDLTSFAITARLVVRRGARIDKLVISPDGRLVAGRVGEDLAVWSTSDGRQLWTRQRGTSDVPVFTADSQRLVASVNPSFLVLDARTGAEYARLEHSVLPMQGASASTSDLFGLLWVGQEGRRMITRLEHAAYAWDVEARRASHLDGLLDGDRQRLAQTRSALGATPPDISAFAAIIRQWLHDCPE